MSGALVAGPMKRAEKPHKEGCAVGRFALNLAGDSASSTATFGALLASSERSSGPRNFSKSPTNEPLRHHRPRSSSLSVYLSWAVTSQGLFSHTLSQSLIVAGLHHSLPVGGSMRPQKNYILHDAGTPSTIDVTRKDDEELDSAIGSPITTLEYFLATLCDLQRAVTTPRFGLRYSKTKEVAELRSKIERCRFTARDLVYSHPNIILSVLKEMFMSLPPLFENEEFLSLSLSSPHELVVSYLVSSIESLPLVKRQRVFLLCSSLRNLLEFTSHRGQSLTDVLMLFTPVVFPRCTLTTEGFLRASRALLIMIEENRLVFGKGFVRQSEEDFLRDLLSSIEGMQLCSYEPDDQTDSDDSGVGLGEDTPATCLQLSDSQYYYTLAYFD